MANSSWFFFYQKDGKESKWELTLAEERASVIQRVKPVFTTVLDLSSIPEDNDWSKVHYRGPYYADFDAEGDLERACDQFRLFLLKLEDDCQFDLTQARLYATGSKGFHIEIPAECFLPKVPATGTTWLPHIYRQVSEALMVDTLDLVVYSGKRGRQWRTPNVRRPDNDCYKVPLSVDEALGMTPEVYAEVIKEPRGAPVATPPVPNTKLVMLFQRGRENVTKQMRGKKKRSEKAHALLDPWKQAKKTPPTIEMIMRGENIAEGVGFQKIAVQLGIYATSVGLELKDYLERCRGLCENHVSDSKRYNTFERRQAELTRMFEYFESDSLYDFEVGPIVRLLKPGTPVPDLGVMDREDREDEPSQPVNDKDTADGDTVDSDTKSADAHKSVRRGFFMNADGMWRQGKETTESICRAVLRQVESFVDIETKEFKGYECSLVVPGRKPQRVMMSGELFTSAAKMKGFFTLHQLAFQGNDADTTALLDKMAEKASRSGLIHTYHREGFFLVTNPEDPEDLTPVKVYLTKDTFLSSIPADDERFFRMRYRPKMATSAYNIDIHHAPDLGEQHIPALHDLLNFNKPQVVGDMLGWMVAAHYRSIYIKLFKMFPLLQVYGEAGSGKSQTVQLLAQLHWFNPANVSIKSAMAPTLFMFDVHASSSTSAPFILDEYKPRELKEQRGKLPKIKDVFKAAYLGADVGDRGRVDRFSDNSMGSIRSQATAPIVFMGEAVEPETAIMERCVTVQISKAMHTKSRTDSFLRLQTDPGALSALGRYIVEMGFGIDLEAMRKEVREIYDDIQRSLPEFNDETRKKTAPRLVYNRAVIVHALLTLKQLLQRKFGSEFDEQIDTILDYRSSKYAAEDMETLKQHSISEISKLMRRLALMSLDADQVWGMRIGKDYMASDAWVDIRIERSYDHYRRYCASVMDAPLFDSLDSFLSALNAYSPVIDKICSDSELRDSGDERVYRFDLNKLRSEGVPAFKD